MSNTYLHVRTNSERDTYTCIYTYKHAHFLAHTYIKGFDYICIVCVHKTLDFQLRDCPPQRVGVFIQNSLYYKLRYFDDAF